METLEAFWVGSAFVAGLAARALRLPVLVGYLAVSLVLSQFNLDAGEWLSYVGDLGVLFLLFTVGLHIRIKNILQPEVLGVGGIHIIISALIFSTVGFSLGWSLPATVLVAVALGFSSTVLTAKSLEARNELGAYHGRIAIGILILQDIVAVGLLAFTGTETPTIWALLLLGLPLLRPLMIRLLTMSGRDELLLLYGLLLALGVGYAFSLVGLSDKLGALVAGMMLTGHEKADELDEQLWGLKEIFLVGFFLDIGLSGFPTMQGMMTVLALLALLPLKAILFFVLLVNFRLRARTAFMTTIALTAYSEFALIVAAAGAEGGILSADVVVMLALLVAASYAVNAPLSSAADALWDRLEPFLIRFERNVDHPDKQPTKLGSTNFIVVGMGDAGAAAYDFFKNRGERPLGLDVDPGRISSNIAAGRRVRFGDPQDHELWDELDLSKIEAVVLAMSTTAGKVRTANLMRERGFDGPISALVREGVSEPALKDAGVSSVCLPIIEAGRELAEVSLREATERRGTTNGAVPEPIAAAASAD